MKAIAQGQTRDCSQDKVQTALKAMEQGVEGVTTSEGFKRYLSTMAKFHSYSWGNVLLILAQRPDATHVAGYKRWQQLGRQVRKGERGIVILAPITRKVGDEDVGETTTITCGFRATHVFDISQTDGDALPEPPRAQLIERGTDTGRWLWERLSSWLNSQGVLVDFGDLNGPLGGLYPVTSRIIIDRRLAGTDHATKTLAHECARFVARHTNATSREDAETVAEAAAFVICDHYGIDTDEYSFAYVAGWAKDSTVLRRNLAAVQNAAHTVITAMENPDLCRQYASEAPDMAVGAS